MQANPPQASLGLLNPGLVSDSRSVDALRAMAARNPQAAVKDAAKQFEALFMQELMKSLRQASLASGMLDNAGSQMGTEMLDAQYASMMTGMPRGLSEAIERQLDKQRGAQGGGDRVDEGAQAGVEAEAEGSTAEFGFLLGLPSAMSFKRPLNDKAEWPLSAPSKTAPFDDESLPPSKLSPAELTQVEFVKQHTQAAREASATTGIPASFMVAQAAHESGWGRREIARADGRPSFNLFGIKATPGWAGPVTEITTTEYHNGRPLKVKAQFRVYDSYEAAFKDYASLLKNSPRYSQVVAQSGSTAQTFAHGLQRAGYATDPAYADKLIRVIHTTLRLQGELTS